MSTIKPGNSTQHRVYAYYTVDIVVVTTVEAETPALQKYVPTSESFGPCPFSSQYFCEGREDDYLTDQSTDKEITSSQGLIP